MKQVIFLLLIASISCKKDTPTPTPAITKTPLIVGTYTGVLQWADSGIVISHVNEKWVISTVSVNNNSQFYIDYFSTIIYPYGSNTAFESYSNRSTISVTGNNFTLNENYTRFTWSANGQYGDNYQSLGPGYGVLQNDSIMVNLPVTSSKSGGNANCDPVPGDPSHCSFSESFIIATLTGTLHKLNQ